MLCIILNLILWFVQLLINSHKKLNSFYTMYLYSKFSYRWATKFRTLSLVIQAALFYLSR